MATANEKAIKSACDWAVKIASDDTFHYVRSKWAANNAVFMKGVQYGKASNVE